MTDVERNVPIDVVDHLLWRDAQHIIGRHSESDSEGTCLGCGERWPCPPRRLAERAAVASRLDWNESWTARHDLYSLRGMTSLRAEPGSRTLVETSVCAGPETVARPRADGRRRNRTEVGARARPDRPRSGVGWHRGHRGTSTT